MGQTEVKLYNSTLEVKITKSVDNVILSHMLKDEEDEEDGIFNEYMLSLRKSHVNDLLPDGWGSQDNIYATSNCGTPYKYDHKIYLFIHTTDTVNF